MHPTDGATKVAGPWRRVARDAGLLAPDGSLASTIFAEMSALAASTGSINLGQGFPDTDGPASMLSDAVDAVLGGRNQYPPGPGIPELRRAIADHQRRFYGLEVDPDREVLVTAGATEAIAAAVLAFCEPGDEVITFEPYYDSYAATISLAGAVRRTVPLRAPAFAPDLDEVAAAFTDRTRVVLVNSPHNPTGAVLDAPVLAELGRLAAERDAVVITDEVYEHLVFDGRAHTPMAGLPGLPERVLTISSAAKTFSVTGWKVGWISGPAALVDAVRTVKQYLTFVNAGPFQPAIAGALGLPDAFFTDLAGHLQRKRDLLCAGLAEAGFEVMRPAATYFVVADATPLGYTDGLDLCRDLPRLCGVVGVPVQVFTDDVDRYRSLVRFAFCKRDDVLAEAASRLAGLRSR